MPIIVFLPIDHPLRGRYRRVGPKKWRHLANDYPPEVLTHDSSLDYAQVSPYTIHRPVHILQNFQGFRSSFCVLLVQSRASMLVQWAQMHE